MYNQGFACGAHLDKCVTEPCPNGVTVASMRGHSMSANTLV